MFSTYVCLLSKVIPRYVPLSVCCSSVSSNIIVTGFDLVDKVKSVVKDLVLLIFTHQSCAQLDNMLVASWSRTLAVVAYSSVLHRTKSSAYIAHFTGAGNFLIRSLMNTKKSIGDMTPPCGTPVSEEYLLALCITGQVGLGVGSWPSNRATESQGDPIILRDLTQECRKNL